MARPAADAIAELSEKHGVKGKLYRQLSKQKKYQKKIEQHLTVGNQMG
ncbi:MAG: hypothetical protein EBE86_033520 [Hormoscilla sp. GUM202]|nr:hypothetical protein [Hormoscilla sp. GUM202]